MRHGSLFSGIGGFDLAAEWMGWENVFHCEWMPFPRQVLKYNFPNSISYEDITKTDFTIHRGSIDILTGGFPCQPYSLAGKRKGTEDSRHLWPEMLRAIREIQPKWILGENVFGIVNWSGGLVFEQVQSEMEAEGYEVQPFVIPACAKDAPSEGIEFGLWPTPVTSDATTGAIIGKNDVFKETSGLPRKINQNGTDGSVGLGRLVQMLPTPREAASRGNCSNDRNKGNLEDAIAKLLPTPDCSDRRSANSKQQGLSNVVAGKASQLNPQFVAEMMGFPTDWTVLPFQNGETNQ